MKKISVVIPTYNSWDTLKKCINSLKVQTIKPFEILVIDNASTDGTFEKVVKFFPKIKAIEMKTNTGVTGGRNEGIRLASKKTDYIFFFDHDMIARENMLQELLKVAESSSDIGIVTPKIFYWSDKKRIWSAGTNINLWTGQVLFRGGKDIGQYNNICEVQVAPAAMLVSNKVINKIKKFDSKYFATYEDTDFCFRAKKFGFKTYYSPKALAYHNLSTNPKDEADRLLRRSYWVGKNRVLFMRDFGKNFIAFLVFLPVYIFYYMRLSVKYRRLCDGLTFIRGTFDGILS